MSPTRTAKLLFTAVTIFCFGLLVLVHFYRIPTEERTSFFNLLRVLSLSGYYIFTLYYLLKYLFLVPKEIIDWLESGLMRSDETLAQEITDEHSARWVSFLVLILALHFGKGLFTSPAIVALLGCSLFWFVAKVILRSKRRFTTEDINDVLRKASLRSFLVFSMAHKSEWAGEHLPLFGGKSQKSILVTRILSLLVLALIFVGLYELQPVTLFLQLVFSVGVVTLQLSLMINDYDAACLHVLANDNARLEQELRTAHDMQMSLMPTGDPHVEGFDISGVCRPAQEVGGDYYDYVWLDRKKTRFGIVIADVSGKAMKAAMTAVMTSGMIYREIGGNGSPKIILREINRPMYLKTDRRIFTAMSFAAIDVRTKQLMFSNAGQMQPIVKRGGQLRELKAKGARLPLGIMEDVKYDEVWLKLLKGDTVLFYTDGLSEAMNERKELFGFDRIESAFRTMRQELSAKEIVGTLFAEAQEFSGSSMQHDDITIVIVKVL